MDNKLKLIEKYLKKKKERKIVNLIIKDYDQSNFYIALVYNQVVEKYKMLFVPLDLIDNDDVEEYMCYQFVKVQLANYILDTIRDCNDLYIDEEFRNKKNPNMTNYYIEVNLYDAKNEYKFTATKYIPKDWIFLYEIIVLLFEHLPHIVSELCVEILSVLNNSPVIEYQLSYNFNLFDGDLENIFSNDVICKGKKIFDNEEVQFLEKANDKYFAIVDDSIVIVEYNTRKEVLNLYCDGVLDEAKICAVLLSIVNNKMRSFYKVKVEDEEKTLYYLCYGVAKDNLKVIHGSKEKLLSIEMFKDGKVQIIDDAKNELEKAVISELEKMYSKKEVEKISKNMKDDLLER